jgi:type IV pilus assembly protein PilQ
MKTPGALAAAVLVSALVAAVPVAQAAPPSPMPEEARISIDFKDVDVTDVVRMLAEVAGFQVVIDPGVSCHLTLELEEVPWQTTLDTVLKVCGLGREEENGIVRVAPVTKLTAEKAERRKLEAERALDRPLVVRSYRLSYARAAELAPLLQKLVSPRGQVFFDTRTNTLFIQDIQD